MSRTHQEKLQRTAARVAACRAAGEDVAAYAVVNPKAVKFLIGDEAARYKELKATALARRAAKESAAAEAEESAFRAWKDACQSGLSEAEASRAADRAHAERMRMK
jgi:hypothetical protein